MDGGKLIYAVDDEETIRELYAVALGSAGFSCKTFCGGAELFAALEEKTPDLILLDIMLDGADGYQILSSLKESRETADVPVIMVSAKGEEISKVKGLNLGADDYIGKPFGVLELVARINANLRKRTVKTQNLGYKDIVIDEKRHVITAAGKELTLTLKEYELLKLLVANAPAVVPRESIFDAVWGEGYFGETRTLDIHVAAIRKSIEGSCARIVTVRGVGYSLQ